MIEERYLTVEQVAARLQFDPETVRRMLRGGRLGGTRLGGRRAGWRIPESEVARVLSGEPQPVPRTSEPRAVAVAEALHRAELARAAGDDELAARFEAMAGGMAER